VTVRAIGSTAALGQVLALAFFVKERQTPMKANESASPLIPKAARPALLLPNHEVCCGDAGAQPQTCEDKGRSLRLEFP